MAYDRHLLYHSLRISKDHRWASAYRRPRPLGRVQSQAKSDAGDNQLDDETRVIPLFADPEHSSHG